MADRTAYTDAESTPFDHFGEGMEESAYERIVRRSKEEPAVLLGVVATCAALIGGFAAFKRGNKQLGNNMLKLRVVAQGSTVVAMLVGASYFGHDREKKRKENAERELERKAAKREAWLHELDKIDEEERHLMARRAEKRMEN